MSGDELRDRTTSALAEGVDAVLTHARDVTPQAPTPCAAWNAHDLVRHLEVIAGAYVLWVGAALGGRTGTLRVAGQLAGYNAKMLRRLPDRPTDQHLAAFAGSAQDHLRLVGPAWDVPMLRAPDEDLVAVGEHAGIAAVEWHLHAWDLARASHRAHAPSAGAASLLAEVWDRRLGVLTDERRSSAGDDWEGVLRASGRTP